MRPGILLTPSLQRLDKLPHPEEVGPSVRVIEGFRWHKATDFTLIFGRLTQILNPDLQNSSGIGQTDPVARMKLFAHDWGTLQQIAEYLVAGMVRENWQYR